MADTLHKKRRQRGIHLTVAALAVLVAVMFVSAAFLKVGT